MSSAAPPAPGSGNSGEDEEFNNETSRRRSEERNERTRKEWLFNKENSVVKPTIAVLKGSSDVPPQFLGVVINGGGFLWRVSEVNGPDMTLTRIEPKGSNAWFSSFATDDVEAILGQTQGFAFDGLTFSAGEQSPRDQSP